MHRFQYTLKNMDILHKSCSGPPRWLVDWRTDISECWENWVCSALRRIKVGGDNYCWLQLPNGGGGINVTEPDSHEKCSEHKSQLTQAGTPLKILTS